MKPFLRQLKQRRLALGFKQSDMPLRVGVSRQQYQRLESKGNPRLDTLELIAKGLNSELLLVPKDKLSAVLAILEADEKSMAAETKANQHTGDRVGDSSKATSESERLSNDPWQDLLGPDS